MLIILLLLFNTYCLQVNDKIERKLKKIHDKKKTERKNKKKNTTYGNQIKLF